MGELEGIHEDVQFDWAGAEALAAKFRTVAGRVDGQVPRRESYAQDARDEWRGLYARKFVGRMRICTSDARALADSMEQAAKKLDERRIERGVADATTCSQQDGRRIRRDQDYRCGTRRKLLAVTKMADPPGDSTREVWALPAPSQEFMNGPLLEGRIGIYILRYDYETPTGEYAWEHITFHDVEGAIFTAHDACTKEQVQAYDALVDVTGSRWIAQLRSRSLHPVSGLRHFRIYFDEVGCYEFAATRFDPPPSR